MELSNFELRQKGAWKNDLFSLIGDTLISLGIQMPIGQEMQVIGGQLLVIVYLWVEI